MSVPLLEAIADAITAFEGWSPGSRSYRNRNPGNLRDSVVVHTMDSDGYCVFETLVEGYEALLEDLYAKVTGKNTHGLSLDSSLRQLFDVYAPRAGGNDPASYTHVVAARLIKVYGARVTCDSTFRSLYTEVAKEPLPSGLTA